MDLCYGVLLRCKQRSFAFEGNSPCFSFQERKIRMLISTYLDNDVIQIYLKKIVILIKDAEV